MADLVEPVQTRAPRRDALERREALIAAASWCFEHHGYDVPLELIAERAGVGRGTLYRNFADREDLALAIFVQAIDRLEARLDPNQPIAETIASTVRTGAPTAMLFGRIAAEMGKSDSQLAGLHALGERLRCILAPAVEAARQRGELASHITAHDVVIAICMVGGLLFPFLSEQEINERIDTGLALLVEGLRPR